MTPPTLFLGLGGTGKDTLMHLRRLFLDEYSAGRMPEALRDRYGPARLPHTAYLCIDADDKMEDIDGRAFDEFMRGAMLTEGEFLNVELDADRVRALYDHPERYPEYSRWFDFGLEKSGIPSHGCGATRPWGRMAFFQHYDRIRQRLRTVMSSLIVATAANDARAIGVDDMQTDTIRVFTVFSIAGGTGSGLFLDMAFLLQDLGRELKVGIKAEAMIVLPEVFSSDETHRVYANAYAALKEIEYYNLRRQGAGDLESKDVVVGTEGMFPVYWPGRAEAGRPLTMRGPVYEPVWLVGARSRGVDGRGGGTVLNTSHKSELTGMIADWLFFRTAPSLRRMTGDINTRASNYAAGPMVATARIPIYEAGEDGATGWVELSCRYGAFGIAKVFAPVNVSAQMAGDQIISDIVNDWLNDTKASPSDSELDNDIRPKVTLRATSRTSQDTRNEDTLYDAIDREGQSAAAGIVSEAADAFAAAFHPSIAEDAGDMLGAQLKQRFSEFQWGATATDIRDAGMRGQYAERIRRSTRAVFDDVRGGLDQVIAEALSTPAHRFPYAYAALNRLAVEFTDLAARAESQANDTGVRRSDLMQDLTELLAHASNERSRFVLRQIAKVAIDYQGGIVRLELEGQIWSAVTDGAKDIVTTIGAANVDSTGATRASLLKALDELRARLQTLSTRLTGRVEGLGARHESILNKIIAPKEKRLYYVDSNGQPITRDFVLSAERKLYGEPKIFKNAGHPSVWALRDRFIGAEREILLAALSEFGRSALSASERRVEVTTLLDHAYEGDDREYANAIRQNVQSGTAWLATTSLGREGDWRSEVNYLVSRPGRGTPSGNRLDNLFANTFGEAQAHFVDGPPEVIYFEQELAAFPLTAVPNLREWRDRAYLPILLREPPSQSEARGGGGGGLHVELNVEKYVDLVEPTREEAARRTEAIQLFIEALVKGRLTPDRDRFGLVHYSFSRWVGLDLRPLDLGRYDRAIRFLSNRTSEEVQTLHKQVEDLEHAWSAMPDQGRETKARILVILDRYINDPELSPVRGAEWVRCVDRLNRRLVARWGADTVTLARDERRSIGQWAVASPVGPEHIIPPGLPDLPVA